MGRFKILDAKKGKLASSYPFYDLLPKKLKYFTLFFQEGSHALDIMENRNATIRFKFSQQHSKVALYSKEALKNGNEGTSNCCSLSQSLGMRQKT